MYTVKELIETLQKCPEDYPVYICDCDGVYYKVGTVGIDNNEETVDLFAD